MSSRSFDKALNLKLRPSLTLAMLLVALHFCAAFCLIVISPINYSVLLLLVLLFSLYYHFRKYILLSATTSVVRILREREGDWHLYLYDGIKLQVELCHYSYTHPLLVILNFKVTKGYRNIGVPLFVDALGKEQHRQLRRTLRLSVPAEKEKILRR